MSIRIKTILLLSIAGLLFSTVFGCVTLSVEEIEEGKAFSEPYYGFADPSKPIEEQSIIINLFKSYSFKPSLNSKETIYVQTIVSAIDGKDAKIPTGKKGIWEIESVPFGKNQIAVLPPGKHTFRIWAEATTLENIEIGDSYIDYIIDLLPGKIYIIRSGFRSGFTETWEYFYMPVFNAVSPPKVIIEIADPNRQIDPKETPLEVNSEKVTVESVIRGINAKFAKK
jgi:hypothetical protein